MKAENENQPGAHWSVWRRGLFFAFTLTLILTLRAEGPEARVVILANSRQAEWVRVAEL